MRLTWAQPEDLLAHELVQSEAEGHDVTGIRRTWTDAGGDPVPAVGGAGATAADPRLRALARDLLDELDALPRPEQPDHWSRVETALPTAPTRPALPHDLRERVHGAWAGRAAGCLLGKPVEKIPREGIEEILRATDRWPLDRYFTAVGLPDDVAARRPWNRRSAGTSLEENIDGMPEDDDLNHPMLALTLMERHGRDFTTDDVAALWLDLMPAGRVFTAERAAYRNLLDARPVPETATRHNPFREWIGALIRTDLYGWTNPGDVRAAARLAWTDARLSHTRDGVYGAMWAAALAACALTHDTVEDVLDAAHTVLPPRSRTAQAVDLGREAAARGDVRSGLDRLHAAYGHLHWVHVLNNAATIAYALTRGEGGFTPSVSIAVTAGWDTDSAAATVGGVVGALRGFDHIGARWTDPLDGRIATSLPGGERRIDDLVTRTLALVEPDPNSPRTP